MVRLRTNCLRLVPAAVLGAALAGVASAAPHPLAAFGVEVRDGDPGCAVRVQRAGRTLLFASDGLRRGGGEPLDARTTFRLASLSKQFTAMATMLLVADGRLRDDSTLAELLPGFPDWARAITVRQLLTHTSGVPDYEEAMDAEAARGGTVYTPERQIHDEDVLALLQRQPAPRFAAGSSWAYSNSGYVLLGLIVARVSHRPFGEFLESRIFRPLRMRDTRVRVAGGRSPSRRAYGHEPADGGFVVADQSATSATLGDGGIYSSVADLARWDAALARHALLPEAAMHAALTPATLADGGATRWPEVGDEDDLAPGQPVAYGYGWFLEPLDGRARMWHFGTTRGFHTAIMRFPDEALTTIVLCNRTDVDAIALATRLARAPWPRDGQVP